MPSVYRSESLDCDNPKLDIFTKDASGMPIDVYVLEYQIFEKVTDPLNPIQVYPTTGRATVDLNLCPTGGKITTGRYHANWDVPSDEILGTHEIKWWFKGTISAPEQWFSEEFEVYDVVSPSAGDYYASVQDIRGAGLADPPSDADVQSAIILWQRLLERATRQWFRPVSLELYLDGNDSDTLFFGIPIISIEEIKINDDTVALDSEYYKVYNDDEYVIDKQNPKICLIDSWNDYRDIFTAPMITGRTLFRKGRKNQYVKGVFGYLENGACPELIKRALIKLVIEKMTNPIVPGTGGITPPPLIAGAVIEEWVDGHKKKWADTSTSRPPGLTGITKDQEILDIIRLYRAPIGLATPADWSYR